MVSVKVDIHTSEEELVTYANDRRDIHGNDDEEEQTRNDPENFLYPFRPGNFYDDYVRRTSDSEYQIPCTNEAEPPEQDRSPNSSANSQDSSCLRSGSLHNAQESTSSNEVIPVASQVPGATVVINDQIIDGVLIQTHKKERFSMKAIVSYLLLGTIITAAVLTFVGNKSEKIHTETSIYYSEAIKEIILPISCEDKLSDPTSPQHDAWVSLSHNEFFFTDPTSSDRCVQTYVVLVLIYSMSADTLIFKSGIPEYYPGWECDVMKCNMDGDITHLSFHNYGTINSAGGSIATEVGHLKSLRMLILTNNNLSGNIPTEIALMKELRTFDISENHLKGSIPTELGQLDYLQYLYVHGNKLTGGIPSEFGELNLRYADFSDNLLEGVFPSNIHSESYLDGILLHQNNIYGDLNSLCRKEYENIHTTWVSPQFGFFSISISFPMYYGIMIDCDDDENRTQCDCCTCSKF